MSIQTLLARYEDAKNRRHEVNSTLEEIGHYVWPAAQDMFKEETRPEGRVRTMDVYDSTAGTAAYRMASGLFSFLMPVGVEWFSFVPRNAEDKEDSEIIEWLSRAVSLTHSEIARSNFVSEMFPTIRSLTVFGTGAISVERRKNDLLYRSHHLKKIFFEENSKGERDVVFLQLLYTAKQAAQEFGLEALSKKVNDAFQDSKPDKFEFVHIVLPNDDRDPNKIDAEGKKFSSIYIEVEEKKEVKKGGFNTNPYKIGLLDRTPDEIIGRSPSFDLLPEIKMVNDMKLASIEGLETAVSPPIVVEDDGVIGQPVTGPRGVMVVRAGAMQPYALDTKYNGALANDAIERQQQIIKSGYFNDLFDALEGLKNISSATEADIRQQSKLVILAPMANGLQKELFDPLIVRSFELIREMSGNSLPPPPKDFDYDVAYKGRLAIVMSTIHATAVENHLALWAPVDQLTPDRPVTDNLDTDRAFRFVAINKGVPAELLVPIDERDEKRAGKKAQEDAIIQAQQAETISKAAKNASGAVDPTSIVAQL